jgi:hypothetical protein
MITSQAYKMRVISSIFALSMFLSCREETISNVWQCGRMTISDALPVQFWLTECETFNEYEAQGVHHVCWCQPFISDDEIVTQVQHDSGQDLNLLIVDSDNNTLYEESFQEIQSGVYQHSLIPSEESLIGQIQLLIVDAGEITQKITDPTFDTGTGWSNDGGPGPSWVVSSGYAEVELTENSPKNFSQGFESSFSDTSNPVKVRITGRFTLIGGNPSGYIRFFFSKDGAVLDYLNRTIDYSLSIIGGAIQTFDEEFFIDDSIDKVIFQGVVQSVGTSDEVSIRVESLSILETSSDYFLAKSDCLDIQTSHDETLFIEYSNQRNFDGLIYANDSPDTTFGIRVPCRFFHEEEPEEDEAMELTSSIVTTSSQVKTQRLLEVKHVPYYFHKKLRRILKHQTLNILNKAWKKEEKYQVNEGDKRWPLKSATCLLTEKNSVVRNVL